MGKIFTSRVTPLSYDRVNGGRIPTSPFPIFNLPIELFQDVTQCMSPQDLAALALVDSDCRQLARSVQFTTCTLKDSHQSLELLDTLCRTNRECDIGVCIRRLRIHVDLRSSKKLYRDSHHSSLLHLFQNSDADWELFLLDRILPSLPNLSILDFNFPVSARMISRLSESSIRHLRLGGGVILPQTSILPSISNNWLLETLVLNSAESSPFTFDLVNRLSGSLQNLTWNDSDSDIEPVVHTLNSFVELRSLVLISSTISPTIFSSLVPPETRLTSLSLDITSPVGMFLVSHGCIPTLERLHFIQPFDEMDAQSLDNLTAVLMDNSHITSLTIDEALTPSFLDSKLLPYLSTFGNLTKLNLTWGSSTISKDSLCGVAALPRLTDLSLSTHNTHLWQVDHKEVIDALTPLNASLERISFSRDSYHVESHPLRSASIDGYYTSKPFPLDIDFEEYLSKEEIATFYCIGEISYDEAFRIQRRILDLAWERWHRESMISHAKAYAGVFGKMRRWVGGQIRVEMLRGGVMWVDTRRRGKRYFRTWI